MGQSTAMNKEIEDAVDEIAGEVGYEKSVDESVRDPKIWTDDYHQGYIDGLNRAIELIKGV